MNEAWIWPTPRAGEALTRLADAGNLAPRGVELGAPLGDLEVWLDEAARWLGIEVESITAPVAQVGIMIERSVPALLRVDAGVIAVVAVRRGRALVLTPDGTSQRVRITDLVDVLASRAIAPAREAVAAQLEALALRGARARRAAAALVAARTRNLEIGGVVSLRLAAEAPISRHARAARLGSRFAWVAIAYGASYLFGLAAWWAIGRGALGGRADAGWLAAWALFVFTALAIRMLGTLWMGRLAIDAAALIKQRLLAGALRAELDALRSEGVGQSLGRVFEATAVEQLAIGGGFLALFATIELIGAAVVLGVGAGGLIHLVLLAATVVVAAVTARRYLVRRRAWTEHRLKITHDLVEAMVGHATRLAQQPAALRHEREDRALLAYATQAAAMDRALVTLQTLVPRGWLVIGAAGLAPVIVAGGASATQLALALGGVLLAHSALAKLTEGATQLAGAAIAWRAIEPLLTAAAGGPATAAPGLALAAPSSAMPAATLRNIVYRHPRRGQPVLAGCDLIVERGDRVLLEGSSGAGKSTLAAVLAGLRRPDAGLVLAGGLDRASLGDSGWRRRVACAPQFHDNHMFSAPLVFNLLLARAWPPTPGDIADAEAVCRELGLGDVLARMPAGLFEMVGETGWQLSHGERCRVFLARALLQNAPLVVLDESLAALDPGTLQIAIACIERRAGAALVIAHP